MSDAPCFCMPLNKGAKIFALVDMAVNLVHAIALVAMCFVWKLSALMDYFDEEKKRVPNLEASKYKYPYIYPDPHTRSLPKSEEIPTHEDLQIFIALLSVSILIHLIFFGLAFMLYSGNKNTRITRIWFIATIVHTLVLFIIAIVLFVNKYVAFTSPFAQFRGSREKQNEYKKSSTKALSGEELKTAYEKKETIFLAVLGFPVCEMITVVYKIYEIVLGYCLLGGGGGGGGGGNATGAPSRAQQSTAGSQRSARSGASSRR